MPDFEVYIDDDRYSVPTLYLITATSEARARRMADELLIASNHHQGVELWVGGESVYAAGSLAAPAAVAEELEGGAAL